MMRAGTNRYVGSNRVASVAFQLGKWLIFLSFRKVFVYKSATLEDSNLEFEDYTGGLVSRRR